MSEDITVVGFDTETHLIAAGDIAPRLVCATYDVARIGMITPTTDVRDTFRTWCNTNGDRGDQHVLPVALAAWQEVYARRSHLVIQNAAFDIPVMMRYTQDVVAGNQAGPTGDRGRDIGMGQDLYLLLWDVLDQNLDSELAGTGCFIHDTMLREKLYRLSTLGQMDHPSGKGDGLADMVHRYFGVDISGSKVTTDQSGRVFSADGRDISGTDEAASSWRLRFSVLDGIPSDQWPPEAKKYAIEDSSWARKVWEVQEGARRDRGPGSINSEALQVYADTALRIFSMPGFRVDKEQLAKVTGLAEACLHKTEQGLMLNGIVRSNGTVDTKILHARIETAWSKLGRFPMLSDKGKISAGAEALEVLAGVDPIIDLYSERQTYAKLQSAFLPNLQGGHVWSNYDCLKETGRTSSYGNSDKGGRRPLYAAVNIQQIPKMDGVRDCFLPPAPDPVSAPKGYVMCSADYKALELCSVAQVTYSLFGFSIHREKINQGYDLHTYLGSGMARVLAPADVGDPVDHEASYAELNRRRKLKVKETDVGPEADQNRAWKKSAGMWRNFAKPVGLGYPGGLGAPTLVTLGKTTYGVEMTEDQAVQFRDLWRQVYPEMPMFFNWVNKQIDPQYGSSDLFCYETQGYNRFRAAVTFCATANGKSMQSLSADGAKRAVCWLARASSGGLPWDSPFALLSDSINLAFIHDETITAHPDDELMTERCLLQSQLMVEAMKISMPDVLIEAEPAVMRRWIKAAEPEWREDKSRPERVLRLLDEYGARHGVANYADIVADAIPKYDPSRYLVPWDDVYRKAAT